MTEKELLIIWSQYKKASSEKRDEIFDIVHKSYVKAITHFSRGDNDQKQAALLSIHTCLTDWHPKHKVQPLSKFIWNHIKFAALSESKFKYGYDTYSWYKDHEFPRIVSVNYITADSNIEMSEYSGKRFINFLKDNSPSVLDQLIQGEERPIFSTPLLDMYFKEGKTLGDIAKAKIYKVEGVRNIKGKPKLRWAVSADIAKMIIADINTLRPKSMKRITRLPNKKTNFINDHNQRQREWQQQNKEKIRGYYRKAKAAGKYDIYNKTVAKKRAKKLKELNER